MRRHYSRERFDEDEDVNPMNYVSNLADVMLVLAVGIMLALIVHWNIDTTPAVTGESAAQVEQAQLEISEEEMENMRDDSVEKYGNMEERGKLMYDPELQTYYIVYEESVEGE